MVISSVIVTAALGELDFVSSEVKRIQGVEVYAVIAEQSKLVLVIESETLQGSYVLVTEGVQSTPGVLNVQLSYCNYEESERI